MTAEPLNGPAVVDAHHHLWDPAVRSYEWMDDSVAEISRRFDVDDLQQAAAPTPVAATIAVQATSEMEETRDLLGVSSRQNPVAGVVGWVDLSAPDVADQLSELMELPGRLVGIRHQTHDEPDPWWLLRDDVLGGLSAVRDAGLVFDLLIRRREADAAIRLAELIPDLALVLDHAGKPSISSGEWDQWREWVNRLAAHEQVSCKVSGLVTEASHGRWRSQSLPDYAKEVFSSFGAERSLFGSDWPVCLLAASYTDVYDLASAAAATLSTAEHDAFFGGTAGRVYHLPQLDQMPDRRSAGLQINQPPKELQ
ncbi:amidohydrolase family protein [Pseudarthrobacter sp. 1C304]|uniref:amidohydrolase family protein n=1 Tax=Pseudarthrobacter sp. 1C304 TaxID=3457438 RepID=UPI003FD5879C